MFLVCCVLQLCFVKNMYICTHASGVCCANAFENRPSETFGQDFATIMHLNVIADFLLSFPLFA